MRIQRSSSSVLPPILINCSLHCSSWQCFGGKIPLWLFFLGITSGLLFQIDRNPCANLIFTASSCAKLWCKFCFGPIPIDRLRKPVIVTHAGLSSSIKKGRDDRSCRSEHWLFYNACCLPQALNAILRHYATLWKLAVLQIEKEPLSSWHNFCIIQLHYVTVTSPLDVIVLNVLSMWWFEITCYFGPLLFNKRNMGIAWSSLAWGVIYIQFATIFIIVWKSTPI